jgi:hypothetical protein
MSSNNKKYSDSEVQRIPTAEAGTGAQREATEFRRATPFELPVVAATDAQKLTARCYIP